MANIWWPKIGPHWLSLYGQKHIYFQMANWNFLSTSQSFNPFLFHVMPVKKHSNIIISLTDMPRCNLPPPSIMSPPAVWCFVMLMWPVLERRWPEVIMTLMCVDIDSTQESCVSAELILSWCIEVSLNTTLATFRLQANIFIIWISYVDWSFWFWFRTLPYVALNQKQVGCFAMRPQYERWLLHHSSSTFITILN